MTSSEHSLPLLASEDEQYDIAEPRADAMIHSLRAFGYDLSTALADLIDNSIAAESKNVWLEFYWNGDASYIAVVDDGQGMNKGDLIAAMRLGSRSPLEARDPQDLGRFGLGLKTASFSQARRLTVGTKQSGTASVRCWDLDYVTRSQAWRLLHHGSEVLYQLLDSYLSAESSGTVVLWEAMDRITPIGTDVNSSKAQSLFLHRAEQVKAHLAMVFHRFLEAKENVGRTPLRIWLNGVLLEPWSPYLTGEKSTQLLTEEAISLFGDRLAVRPYVLPHYNKISPSKHKEASGPKGWNAQQGFYVYRNKRLLVAGSWLGLGFQQEEHYKLARIQLDIPNHMDAEWEIDVKKSRASPPPAIREQLKNLATVTRSKAAAVYRHRGARIQQGQQKLVFLWEAKTRRSKIFYEVNRSHPLVQAAISAGGEKVRALLHLIEETVPIPTITKDWAEDPQKQAAPFEEAAPATLRSAINEVYAALRTAGLTDADAKFNLLNTEPFNQFPEMVAALCETEGQK